MANMTPMIALSFSLRSSRKHRNGTHSWDTQYPDPKEIRQINEEIYKAQHAELQDGYNKSIIFPQFDSEEIDIFERALKNFDEEKIAEMVKNGFKLNQRDEHGDTLLSIYNDWHLHNGFKMYPSLEYYLQCLGAKTREQEKWERQENQRKLINQIEKSGNVAQTVELLKTSNIDLSSRKATMLLMKTLQQHDFKAAEMLVLAGVDVNKPSYDGITPLAYFLDCEKRKIEHYARSGLILQNDKNEYIKIVDFMKKHNAKEETPESLKIKEQYKIRLQKQNEIRQKEAAILKEKQEKEELNNSKLAKFRKSAAQRVDKLAQRMHLKTNIAQKEINPKLKGMEKKISDTVLGKTRD